MEPILLQTSVYAPIASSRTATQLVRFPEIHLHPCYPLIHVLTGEYAIELRGECRGLIQWAGSRPLISPNQNHLDLNTPIVQGRVSLGAHSWHVHPVIKRSSLYWIKRNDDVIKS